MLSERIRPANAEANWWRRIPYIRAVIVFGALRLATLLIVALANVFTHHGLINDLSIWDGAWFLQAVHHGWPAQLPMVSGHVAGNPIAFYPLLPLLLRALSWLTGTSAAVIGLIVSGLTGLSAVIAVGVLTNEFAGAQKADRAALLFALTPGGFVFNLIYAEGLLITFVAFGLWALLRRKWLVAGLLGALATATSPVGLAFVVSCVVVAIVQLRREREWRVLFAPVLAPLGFATWMAYLWIHTGNLMAWRLTERGGWNSYPSLVYPFHIMAKFISNPISPTMTGQILFFGTLIGVIGLVITYREHQPVALLSYTTSAVVLFLISAPVGLRPRFIMLAFPLAIGAATRWSGWRYRAVVSLSTLILVLMTYETLTSFAVFP